MDSPVRDLVRPSSRTLTTGPGPLSSDPAYPPARPARPGGNLAAGHRPAPAAAGPRLRHQPSRRAARRRAVTVRHQAHHRGSGHRDHPSAEAGALVRRYQSRRKFITRFRVSAKVSERARPSLLMTRSTEMARTDSVAPSLARAARFRGRWGHGTAALCAGRSRRRRSAARCEARYTTRRKGRAPDVGRPAHDLQLDRGRQEGRHRLDTAPCVPWAPSLYSGHSAAAPDRPSRAVPRSNWRSSDK